MNIEDRNERQSGYRQFMAYVHLGMGVVFLTISVLVLFNHKFGLVELDSKLTYGLGFLFLLYGIFRIWRGVTDMRGNRKRR